MNNQEIKINNEEYLIIKDGHRYYYKEGKYHRENGPAIETANGDKYWYKNGELHREDGPAMETARGTKSWYYEGKSHRLDGPSTEYYNGGKEWCLNGIKHASESVNGVKIWYLCGHIFFNENQYKTMSKRVQKVVNKFKSKLKNKYINVLKETNSCNEKFLYNLIASYII
jgi:hypothetical protein